AGVKAAEVAVVGYELVRSGVVALVLAGEVAAVTAAVEQAVQTASGVGRVYRSMVLARPYDEVVGLLGEAKGRNAPKEMGCHGEPAPTETSRFSATAASAAVAEPRSEYRQIERQEDPWSEYTVVELRRMVRKLNHPGLTGREISRANRQTLVDILRRHAAENEEE
ncbi:MAG: BMC domain-containing protein, partial [Alicyclobacillaceae bacterium]|nr:BMC domain-containing protein [Alicyclobacillaceae bacterium]